MKLHYIIAPALGVRNSVLILILLFVSFMSSAQEVEIELKTKITNMDTVVNDGNKVVRLDDGTLALSLSHYQIGDMAHGGIVFYLNDTGEHGLVCATADQGAAVRWYAGTFGNTQAKGNGVFAGSMNTAIIIASHVAIGDDNGDYAARRCNQLNLNGYADWYLPSRTELNLMYTNLHLAGLGGFGNVNYWSSSEHGTNVAWRIPFSSGTFTSASKSSVAFVRPIRAF